MDMVINITWGGRRGCRVITGFNFGAISVEVMADTMA